MKKLLSLFIFVSCMMSISAQPADDDAFLYLYFEISPQNDSDSHGKSLYELFINSYIPALAADTEKTDALISEYLRKPDPTTRAFADVYKKHFSYKELEDLVKLRRSDEYLRASKKTEGSSIKIQAFVDSVCQAISNDSNVQDLSVDRVPKPFSDKFKQLYAEKHANLEGNFTVLVEQSMAKIMNAKVKTDSPELNIDLSSMSFEEMQNIIQNSIQNAVPSPEKFKDNPEFQQKCKDANAYVERNFMHFSILNMHDSGITLAELEALDNPLLKKESRAILDMARLNQKDLQKELLYDFNDFLKTKGYEVSPVDLKKLENTMGF